MKLNRRSFLAGLLTCTARCSFGLALPKIKIDEITGTSWTTNDSLVSFYDFNWAAFTEVVNEMKQPNGFINNLLYSDEAK